MTRPKRIVDPHAGHYRFVVSFRVERTATPMDRWLRDLRGQLAAWAGHHAIDFADLDIAVTVVGAGGERSEHEGTVGPLATEGGEP